MSIEVVVNGGPMRFEDRPSVDEVVAKVSPSPRGIAVAVDRVVVPRSAWGDTILHDGAHVEIVSAAAGG